MFALLINLDPLNLSNIIFILSFYNDNEDKDSIYSVNMFNINGLIYLNLLSL
jgi:hypothetical protein